MRPVILIVEPRSEVAQALEEVLTSAKYDTVVRPYLDRLTDLDAAPSAIIVRIAFEGVGEPPHAALARIPDRPPVVAIAWEDREVAEAVRLHCEVVLRAPQDVGRLCDVLRQLLEGSGQSYCVSR